MEHEIKVTVVEYADRENLVLRYVDPITGKQKTRSAKTSDRKAATKAATIWEAELRSGTHVEPSRMTWAEFRQRFTAEHLATCSTYTQKNSGVIFDTVERLLNPQKLRDLTSQRISWLAAELRKDTKSGDAVKFGITDASVRSYFSHLKAALRWAERFGFIAKAPAFPRQGRSAAGDAAKGRALSGEEFDRMLAAVPKVVGEARAAEWQRFARGLWLSGFRINEALALSWDDGAGIQVDITGRNPVAHISAASQKSRKTQTLPLAPDFGDFLAETPAEARTGFVFNPLHCRNGRPGLADAIRTIAKLGRRANVKTWVHPKSGKVKCASAHDLRRSFGTRWASLVMPATLQQMMRHTHIATTMRYYVTRNAQTTGDDIRAAMERAGLVTNRVTPRPKLTPNAANRKKRRWCQTVVPLSVGFRSGFGCGKCRENTRRTKAPTVSGRAVSVTSLVTGQAPRPRRLFYDSLGTPGRTTAMNRNSERLLPGDPKAPSQSIARTK